MTEDPTIDGTLQLTEEGTIPAPDWYESYEGAVEIVTPALTVTIESRATLDGDPRKLTGETAPFPLETDPWQDYGTVDGMGLDPETATKTKLTQPDKILFDLDGDQRLYQIEGLSTGNE
ncbi:hypothetical protein [Halanaeroarchaeum sulfurireducens]|uniref:Uncharacterized protein n=1 Tax=Halanaeroarchaeum sulfurireducens TaxID=1604004 RepID=A0A0F7PBD6_9EURY|nr:hypothetical protein [Halanaeroarchaeum sulfurireducens]AKH97485.1 hypothetical protein HLASF_0996 [Halanaeroarchaeum sulfurireducens]ALG81881.1 hypothetical protein HLASA_0985 [Halanaeroarchaeum sulfurireducens]